MHTKTKRTTNVQWLGFLSQAHTCDLHVIPSYWLLPSLASPSEGNLNASRGVIDFNLAARWLVGSEIQTAVLGFQSRLRLTRRPPV